MKHNRLSQVTFGKLLLPAPHPKPSGHESSCLSSVLLTLRLLRLESSRLATFSRSWPNLEHRWHAMSLVDARWLSACLPQEDVLNDLIVDHLNCAQCTSNTHTHIIGFRRDLPRRELIRLLVPKAPWNVS